MKNDKREIYVRECERAANSGHYLDRLTNIAIALNDRDSEIAILSLRQLYTYAGCKPKGADGIMTEISMRLLHRAKYQYKFTQKQLSLMWYGVHWDAREAYGLKFPYDGIATNEMKANTN